MNLQQRIDLLQKLKNYLEENGSELQAIKNTVTIQNSWFTPEFINISINNICTGFLQEEKLNQWVSHYHLDDNIVQKNIGLVMAGNIPLVGFHDFLCIFISGHSQTIKLSAKDNILLKHLIEKLYQWESNSRSHIYFAELLKDCEAYIATGSNNSARYFEQYFSKYPHIIRRNRTSVAILTGNETSEQLKLLSDDIHLYFGLGCRNVTQLFVPEDYDFIPLLHAFDKYKYFSDHHKYRNNYDYQLTIALMNNIHYMTNQTTLLMKSNAIFSAISQVNYSYYDDAETLHEFLKDNENIQCIIGDNGNVAFGQAQKPALFDYADGIDTMQFLLTL